MKTGEMRVGEMREEIAGWYAGPGVREACLGLQERHGVDVSLFLALLWMAAHGAEIGEDEARRAAATARRYREGTVLPLRRARRWLKGEAEAFQKLRAQIQAAEIEAEFLLMERCVAEIAPHILEASPPISPTRMTTVASLANLLITDGPSRI